MDANNNIFKINSTGKKSGDNTRNSNVASIEKTIHDLNSSLAIIKSSALIIQTKFNNGNIDDIHKHLQKIIKHSDLLKSLIDDFRLETTDA